MATHCITGHAYFEKYVAPKSQQNLWLGQGLDSDKDPICMFFNSTGQADQRCQHDINMI